MARPRVCVVGSSNMDLIVRTPRLPGPGETVTGTSLLTCCGGKGGNQAVMAARLGAEVALVGRVGRDSFGDQLLHNYHRSGVDVTHVNRDPRCPSGVATILVDDAGENRIVVVPGANETLTAKHVRKAADWIRACDVLLCQLEVPLEATRTALELAGRAGRCTVLNPAPFRRLPDDLWGLVQVLVVNETELGQLTRLAGSSGEELEKAATRVWNRTAATVVVTLGERGVLWVDGTGPQWAEPVRVKAVDTTGAGDAFIGALACGLGRLPMVEAVRQANAIAALTVTRPGTQASYPTRKEAKAFLAASGGVQPRRPGRPPA
jgi:ribokinase